MSNTNIDTITANTAPSASVTPTTPITWEEFAAVCSSLDEGVFAATVQADGRPHLAWVMPGWDGDRLWFATFASSQKAHNLRHQAEVSLHWPQRPDAIAFCRATARLVADVEESNRLWDSGVLPYDLGNFFSGKEDPDLLFVELTPTLASVNSLDPTAPRRRWTAAVS